MSLLLLVTPVVADAQKNGEMTVKIGGSARFLRSGLKVRFLKVVEDSRCPEGVDCIWAGNARIQIEVRSGRLKPTVFELDTNGEKTQIEAGGYAISIKRLDPYPKSDSQIIESRYTAKLAISKLLIN